MFCRGVLHEISIIEWPLCVQCCWNKHNLVGPSASVTFVTVCPLGTVWLLISANCLWVKFRHSCTLLLQLGDANHLVTSHSVVYEGRYRAREPRRRNALQFSCAAGCGDASRVPRQLSFQVEQQPLITLTALRNQQPWKKQKSNTSILVYRTCSGMHTHCHTHT